MATIILPTSMQPLCGHLEKITIPQTMPLAQLLKTIIIQYPMLKTFFFDIHGNMSRFLNIYVNSQDSRDLPADQPIYERDEVCIVTSLSGG